MPDFIWSVVRNTWGVGTEDYLLFGGGGGDIKYTPLTIDNAPMSMPVRKANINVKNLGSSL